MSKHPFAPFALLAASLCAPVAALTLSPASVELVLKDRDHQKLGDLLKRWIASFSDRKQSTAEARDKVQAELDAWAKKRELGGKHPLALTEDLGRALFHSNAYEASKGIRKGKVTAVEMDTLEATPRKIEYGFHAPARYAPKDGPFPFLLCIPDVGEKPTDHLTERWLLPDLRENVILAAIPLPESAAAPDGEEARANLFSVFVDVTRTYAVDFDRIFIAGRGKGVEVAMQIAARFPDRFAGVVGRSGDCGVVQAENFSNLPTFFAGAGAQASAFAEACKAAGFENVTILPEGKEEQVLAWVRDHARRANPEEVRLVPGSPFPHRAYWLQVPRFDNSDGRASIRAKVDRASNTITVESKGISEVILFLNDQLVDLDRPLKVVCNGVENEDLVQRSFYDFLEFIRTGRSDPGKLYTASKRYDIRDSGE